MPVDKKVSTLVINQVPYDKKDEPTYSGEELYFIEDNLSPNKFVKTNADSELITADLVASDIPDLSATYYSASNPSGYQTAGQVSSSISTALTGYATQTWVGQQGFITSSAIIGKEDTSNKVTSISSSSTNTQYPSAKCVYDIVGNIEATLQAIRGV